MECGSVLDLDFDSKEVEKAFNIEAAKGFGGEIEGNVTFFYGKCPKCVTKKK